MNKRLAIRIILITLGVGLIFGSMITPRHSNGILIAVNLRMGVGVGYEYGLCGGYAVMRPSYSSFFLPTQATANVTVQVHSDTKGEYVCAPPNVVILPVCDANLISWGYRCANEPQRIPIGGHIGAMT